MLDDGGKVERVEAGEDEDEGVSTEGREKRFGVVVPRVTPSIVCLPTAVSFFWPDVALTFGRSRGPHQELVWGTGVQRQGSRGSCHCHFSTYLRVSGTHFGDLLYYVYINEGGIV